MEVLARDVVFDEDGGLRGPWNAEVCSPLLGKHLEQLASAVRNDNSLEPRLCAGLSSRARTGPWQNSSTSTWHDSHHK